MVPLECQLALCPKGNVVVDSFRLYEAMTAGAIPIVEDDGSGYWREVFGPEFPCLMIQNWDSLPGMISAVDVKNKSREIKRWWNNYLEELKMKINKLIQENSLAS